MFPYPSGAGLHVGHVRNYSITDAIARFQRQNGQNTLTTIGWDGFGLPAENYAINTGTPPAVSTTQNIANFKSQLSRLGMSYDWSRELNTTDPSYYKWTQYLFTKLFEQGLAYQKESLQWWCPHDKTVLANEQVENGRCWRCGHEVVKKNLKQWFFKITEYADALLDGIDDLDWPEKIKTMQRNWIGRSKGASIKFQVESSKGEITVFTTRPDTIFGATFLVLAPEHEFIAKITTSEQKAEVDAYIKAAQKKSEIERQENKEKTGVFTGAYALNPATGGKIPVWTADYVLGGYGTGAIMAVPAHDERDNEFAKKFDLPIEHVIEPKFIADTGDSAVHPGEAYVKREAICAIVRNPKTDEYLCMSWKSHPMHGLVTGGVEAGEDPVDTAKREVYEETGYKNLRLVDDPGLYIHSLFYHRQKQQNRWAHFHFIFFELENDERDPVDEKEAALLEPVWLPKAKLQDYFTVVEGQFIVDVLNGAGVVYAHEGVMVNSGPYDGLDSAEAREKIVTDLEKQGVAREKVQYRMRDWLISRQRYWGAPIPIIHCPKDGAVAVPEKDLPVVLPEVKDYEPDGSGKGVLAKVDDWVNVPCPKCGGEAKRETDTMDGYVDSSWYLFRYADAHNDAAPWDPAKVNYWAPLDFYCGGDHAVAHLLYVRFWTHVFAKMGLVDFTEPVKRLVYNGYIYAADGTKMSKSKGNVVDPLEVVDSGYGADALRTYELFCGPYEQDTAWDPGGVAGTFRFLQRVWALVQEYSETDGGIAESLELERLMHRTIKKVSHDLEQLSFNTAIAALMECVNGLYKLKAADSYAATEWQWALECLVQLLAPFAPHIAEELWEQLGGEGSVHVSSWPTYDETYLVESTVTIAVQVNGKLRGTIAAPAGSDEKAATELAHADERIAGNLAGKQIVKTIYVPDKLLNFVVK